MTYREFLRDIVFYDFRESAAIGVSIFTTMTVGFLCMALGFSLEAGNFQPLIEYLIGLLGAYVVLSLMGFVGTFTYWLMVGRD